MYIEDRIKRIIVTGGAGFIGSNLILKLFDVSKAKIYNLDKLGYASNLIGINNKLIKKEELKNRYELVKVDLKNKNKLDSLIEDINPDLVFHLAAESHVDRSIDYPEIFLESNVIGTFNLLVSLRNHWKKLSLTRKKFFRFVHVSTDEVFGSLHDNEKKFDESTPYDPKSPYSASKASSDHFVKSWVNTYDFPALITNCSNNYGPWQFPEKLIPLVIMKAINLEQIPLYGDGLNVRDWLFVDDHTDALITVASKGKIGNSYCIGGVGESTNKNIVEIICKYLDELKVNNYSHLKLIKYVKDRPGHDRRYSINSSLIRNQLDWNPSYSLNKGIKITVDWYLNNLNWCNEMNRKSKYKQVRIGLKR